MGKTLSFTILTLCVALTGPARAAEPEGVTEWIEGEEPAAKESLPAVVEAPVENPPEQSVAGAHADLPAAIDAVVADIVTKTQGRTLAVAPFLPLGPNVRERRLGDIAAELLATRLVKSGKVKVVERGQLDRILEETKLSLLGLTDAANASKVGQMLGADLVVVGSVSETGELISVSIRAVGTGSSEALAAWESRFPAATAELLSAKYVVQKSRSDALFRSLLIPGWGQSYNGDDTKAAVFFGTGLALVGFSVAEHVRFNAARDDYDAATNPTDAVRGYERMVDLDREKKIVWLATAVFWGFNAAEAFISGTSASSVRVEASAAPTGAPALQVAYRY